MGGAHKGWVQRASRMLTSQYTVATSCCQDHWWRNARVLVVAITVDFATTTTLVNSQKVLLSFVFCCISFNKNHMLVRKILKAESIRPDPLDAGQVLGERLDGVGVVVNMAPYRSWT